MHLSTRLAVPQNTPLFARTPWQSWRDYLPFLGQQRLHVELYLTADCFEQISPDDIAAVRRFLTDHSRDCTLHAPTAGMDTGTTDATVQEETRQRLLQTIRLAKLLKARSVVAHTGYSPALAGSELEAWTARSIAFWSRLLPALTAADGRITLENVSESHPSQLRSILEGVRNRRLQHCFDIGHFNIHGSVALETWFAELGRYCTACHLHDNRGSRDEHLPPGEGTVDFTRLFGLLLRHAPAAYWVLEAPGLEQLHRFCSALQRLEIPAAARPAGRRLRI